MRPPDEVVEAALTTLEQQERLGDFDPGELDELLAVGEADIAAGNVYDGEAVFSELEELSAERHRIFPSPLYTGERAG